MNVKYDDEHRFKIVNENNNKNNNKEFLSQTKVIDTPGFGDTKGIEFENQIISMIFDKIKTINKLTSICIIAKSNNIRFYYLERYIYNNVAKLFAKDLISNFIFLFTFCDIQKPLTKKMFKKGNSFYNIIIKTVIQDY